MNYIVIILCCFLLLFLLYYSYRLNKTTNDLNKTRIELHELQELKKGELKDYFKEEWDRQEKILEDELTYRKKEIDLLRKAIEQEYEHKGHEVELKLYNLELTLKEKEKRYEEVNQDLETYRKGKIDEIDSAGAEYEKRKRLEIEQALKQRELQANSDFNNQVDSYIVRKAQMESELEKIQADLEEERTKRAAINEEIRRRREVEMKQEFYRIQFSEEDKNDVEILRSVAPRLRHPEAINKVIWSAYYQKPLAELRKRLLPNGDKSGIYKITRLKTNEIYIGSTTSFDTRFVNHYKTALGVGTLASSQLHRTMREDGPEHFTVEILEEDIPKEKLKERESYYIDFYDSKTYGLNTIRGEQK